MNLLVHGSILLEWFVGVDIASVFVAATTHSRVANRANGASGASSASSTRGRRRYWRPAGERGEEPQEDTQRTGAVFSCRHRRQEQHIYKNYGKQSSSLISAFPVDHFYFTCVLHISQEFMLIMVYQLWLTEPFLLCYISLCLSKWNRENVIERLCKYKDLLKNLSWMSRSISTLNYFIMLI